MLGPFAACSLVIDRRRWHRFEVVAARNRGWVQPLENLGPEVGALCQCPFEVVALQVPTVRSLLFIGDPQNPNNRTPTVPVRWQQRWQCSQSSPHPPPHQ
eukprot:10535130-Alexandrium_andersonii.AAC.1